jgi:hypothetical protein
MSRRVFWAAGSAVLCALCLFTVLAMPAGAQSQGEAAKPRREPPGEQARPAERAPAKAPTNQEAPAPPPPREIATVRFEATIFQVELAPERAPELDVKTLTAEAARAVKLAQALQKFGDTKVLYRVDQRVTADGGRQGKIEISQDTPYVTTVQKSAGGENPTSIGRQHVGASFELFAVAAEGAPPGRVQATVRIELSAMSDSDLKVGGELTAPTFWRISQSYGGPTDLGKPIVLVSADSSRGGGSSKSMAFVTLLQLSPP